MQARDTFRPVLWTLLEDGGDDRLWDPSQRIPSSSPLETGRCIFSFIILTRLFRCYFKLYMISNLPRALWYIIYTLWLNRGSAHFNFSVVGFFTVALSIPTDFNAYRNDLNIL